MNAQDLPPIVSVVGRKNSGKTTLVVALAAELKRRGHRVATVKHGHHRFEIDQPGRDSWRHLHEGGAEAVLIVSSHKVAMVMHTHEEPDPRELIQRHFGEQGYGLVLVEGYKRGPFPKVEVYRRAVHDRPLYDRDSADHLAVVTDDLTLAADCPVIPLRADGGHAGEVAQLLEATLGLGGGK